MENSDPIVTVISLMFLLAAVIALHALFVLMFRPGRRKAAAFRLAGAMIGAPVAMIAILAFTIDVDTAAPQDEVAHAETAEPSTPDTAPARQDVRAAREALELHYISNRIYYPVRCGTEETQGQTMIFCYAVRGAGTIGGLYIVQAGPQLFTVNGKAMQHMGLASDEGVFTADRNAIPVSRWTGDRIDIPASIEAFQ